MLLDYHLLPAACWSYNDDVTGTSYPKSTIKPYKIHYKYNTLGSVVGSAQQATKS